jgi:predicted TIM-barrel fold metal-dependent hydrolase
MLLELMHANQVTHTTLIQVIHYRWDNGYLASVLRRYPGTFHGVCRVDPNDPASPGHLTRLTEERGFHGVRLSPAAGPDGDWIRGPLMPPLWRRCALLKVPMTLLLPSSRLPDIEPLMRANPELQVVIDHMADVSPLQPAQLDRLLALAQYPNAYVKISHIWSLSAVSYPFNDMQRQVAILNATFGAKRLMWGTDWPVCLKYLSYDRAVALYRDHLSYLPIQDREQILYRTSQQVWKIG